MEHRAPVMQVGYEAEIKKQVHMIKVLSNDIFY